MQTLTPDEFQERYDEVINEYFNAIDQKNTEKLNQLEYIFEYDIEDSDLNDIADSMYDTFYNSVVQGHINFVYYFYDIGNDTSREEEEELYNVAMSNGFLEIANFIRFRRNITQNIQEEFKTILPSFYLKNDDVCSICLDNNNDVKLDCGHEFHIQCLKDYKKETNKNKCPNCRAENMLYGSKKKSKKSKKSKKYKKII